MNPWKQNALSLSRDMLRFTIWACIVLNGLMFSLFTILFTALLVFRVSGYVFRNWFANPW